MNEYKELDSDILIIGSGGAGLRAAIEAGANGASVVVVSKSLLGKAHTVMAEGGIAASLGDVDSKDSWEVHFSDTIIEGVFLGNWRMAEILAKEAPERVYELERYGALFDRTPEGKIMQRAFGAHTYRRLCHVGDKTGLELIRTLEDRILHMNNISVMDETLITKIVSKDNKVIGAIGFEMKTGKFVVFNTKSVIIATGGLGRIYKITSNSWESTGDGIALAFKAGAKLVDMEMIQFHPTGMVWPPGVKGLLVTEGVRGEGGILLNSKGERFMLRYSPKKKELDARDVVARAIYNEIKNGNGTEHGGVYLDITHKGAAFIKKKLPAMYEQFKEFAGIDITKEKMEVAPTVHYFMGGILVDAETCKTNIEGLYAAGETAGGLHGANRLGGNSLADILVFGRRAGLYASEYIKNAKAGKIGVREIEAEIDNVKKYIDNKNNGVNPYEMTDKLRNAMEEYVGIIRNEKDLKTALDIVYKLKKESAKCKVSGDMKFNKGFIECIELNNMLLLAECMIKSALERKESRGAHTRSDYPEKSSDWEVNIICNNVNGDIILESAAIPEIPERLKKILKQ
ncbi:MAG: FAD-binding protein [Candidatus Marsarchaeota archaeon]|nr:FAD-binding protein [Candidatus Marsarchaeota archaeon]